MKMRLLELHYNNKKIRKLGAKKLPEDSKNIKEILHYQDFLYVFIIICSELINRYYDNLLADHFRIENTQELIA